MVIFIIFELIYLSKYHLNNFNKLKMSSPNFVPTVFSINGETITIDAVVKTDTSFMLNFNCEGYKSLKSSDSIIGSNGKKYLLSRNFLNEKKEIFDINKSKINFEEKEFILNGATVPIRCVLTPSGSIMCDTYSPTFDLLQNAKTIDTNDGKSYILNDKFLNENKFQKIDVNALFDREDGFQGTLKLSIQSKDPSKGGLIINQEIFQTNIVPIGGFVCLIDDKPWRIVSNDKGIWAHPIPGTELFRTLKRRGDEKV